MYINNFISPYDINKEENKCGRIFRPWDSQSAEKKLKDNSQDSTVSTTTQEDDEIMCLSDETVVKIELSCCKSDEKEYIKEQTYSSSQEKLESRLYPEKNSKSVTTDIYAASNSNKLTLNTSLTVHKRPSNHLSPQSQHFQYSPYQKHEQKHLTPQETLLQTGSSIPLDFIQDSYNQIYPELMQTNLAQHLGLPPNDPLLLESIAQGYALEEYARVLNQEQHAKLLAAKKQRPKKYKCPHCDVGFSNNGQLKGHIRIHTGERPFKCDDKECGKTFTRNEELTRHKRIHSGLRPFPCTHCGKRFGRKDHLKKHSRTHFQPRGLYAVPVVLPFEAWASGQTNGYPFLPMMY